MKLQAALARTPGCAPGVTLQSFPQCGLPRRGWQRSFLSLFICFTSFTPETGDGTSLEPEGSALPAVPNYELGGKGKEPALG